DPVLPDVLFVANANQCLLQQANDGGEDLLAWQSRSPEIRFGPAANARQHFREVDQPSVLHFVSDVTPARVIPILLAPFRVAAGPRQMTRGIRADPDVGPGRRTRQRLDPRNLLGPADRPARGVDVAKP